MINHIYTQLFNLKWNKKNLAHDINMKIPIFYTLYDNFNEIKFQVKKFRYKKIE